MYVVSLGEVLVDWLSLTPGKTLMDAPLFHRALGGNSTNVAIGLARLGVRVSLVGRIGNDLHGEFIKASLAAEQVDATGVAVDPVHLTTQCYMTTTADGEHEYRNWPHPNANDMLAVDDLPAHAIKTCDLIHTTALSMVVDPRCTTIEHALSIAEKSGTIISFDACLPKPAFKRCAERVEKVLSRAHLLKMNAAELTMWHSLRHKPLDGDDDSLRQMAKDVFLYYKPVVLITTMGARGCLLISEQHTIVCPPLCVEPLSEVGAGDGFMAGFIYALGQALPQKNKQASQRIAAITCDQLRKAGLAGNICGALATLGTNAYGGLPHAEQLNEHLSKLE